jgi:hypothetical protein
MFYNNNKKSNDYFYKKNIVEQVNNSNNTSNINIKTTYNPQTKIQTQNPMNPMYQSKSTELILNKN